MTTTITAIQHPDNAAHRELLARFWTVRPRIVRSTCETCGNDYSYETGEPHKLRRFCSTRCYMVDYNERRRKAAAA